MRLIKYQDFYRWILGIMFIYIQPELLGYISSVYSCMHTSTPLAKQRQNCLINIFINQHNPSRSPPYQPSYKSVSIINLTIEEYSLFTRLRHSLVNLTHQNIHFICCFCELFLYCNLIILEHCNPAGNTSYLRQ